ncbi:MAG: hypothetical protein O7G87_14345 [bacterium]|nr:hypothetical protein [bacterium]
MSPKAIRGLIDLFGVEEGLQLLNLLTAPDDWAVVRKKIRSDPVAPDPDPTTPAAVMCRD